MIIGNPEEGLNFSEIEDFIRRAPIEESDFDSEIYDFESNETDNLGIIVSIIKNSKDIIIPETLDIDNISPKDLTSLLSWQNNESENFLRVLSELTFALNGAQKGLYEDVAEAASSIAHFDFLTNQEVFDWFRIIEDLTQLQILSGDKLIDKELIADLDLLQEEKIRLERLISNIKSDVAQELTEELGDHRDIELIADNLVRFTERLYVQLETEGTEFGELNYLSIFAKNEIMRMSKGYLDEEIISSITQLIYRRLYLEEYKKINLPIFQPK